MTTDAELITLSFEIAAERCDDLTPVVYRRLFSDHPEMERLFFRDAQTHAVRGEMLARVIEAILDFVGPLGRPSEIAKLDGMVPEKVPAREPGGGVVTPIEDAPGSYVRARSCAADAAAICEAPDLGRGLRRIRGAISASCASPPRGRSRSGRRRRRRSR